MNKPQKSWVRWSLWRFVNWIHVKFIVWLQKYIIEYLSINNAFALKNHSSFDWFQVSCEKTPTFTSLSLINSSLYRVNNAKNFDGTACDEASRFMASLFTITQFWWKHWWKNHIYEKLHEMITVAKKYRFPLFQYTFPPSKVIIAKS